MKTETLNWLLNGSTWIKYAVEAQLMKNKSNSSLAIKDKKIQSLVSILKYDERGFNAIYEGKASYTKEVFWYLFFLADIGFTAKQLNIKNEFNKIIKLEDKNHRFVLSKEMKPNYFCISSILLASMARMSESIKKQLYPHLKTIMDSQRLDGGWHCAIKRSVGKNLQHTESCLMDNLNILLFLGQYDEFKTDRRLNGALDLLINHWEKRNEKYRPYGFGIGTEFTRLRYPAFKYGILRVLDVLSLYPYAMKSEGFHNMLSYVHQKSSDGKYFAESVAKIFNEFDFGQKKEPSRWITFLIERVGIRINESLQNLK